MTNLPEPGMFRSARDKIERARHHFVDLQTELREYKSRDPFQLIEVGDGDSVEIQVRVTEKIPTAITLVLGDCVHNLRSALDHIVYEAVAKSGTSNCDFPIWGRGINEFTKKDWKSFVRNKVQGANAAALRRYLETLRPYEGGSDEYLWVLHRLDIIDKHRLLLAVCAATESIKTVSFMHGVQVNDDGTNEVIQNMAELEVEFIPPDRYPLDDGTVLLRLPTEEMAYLKSMTPRLSIALAEPEPLAGHELESAIGELIGKIDGFINDSENFLLAPANGSST